MPSLRIQKALGVIQGIEMWLLTNLAATLFLTGLVWFVQVVHYPLYANVGAAEFATYETAHTRLTTYVVVVPMLVELVASGALLFFPPFGARPAVLWLLAALTGIIWLSTVLIQIPQHDKLVSGFDLSAQQLLVSGNWIRTAAWTLRSGILLWLASGAIASTV
ncbi:MAG: hypothetical protein ABI823_12435 [Bryobacteraceae bacterium]